MEINKHHYSAFTLIEMLIVMTIFGILLAIGIEAFSGLRSTILMNQSIENFKQNAKWTQRAGILLKREPGENWVYGVGLDLKNFYSDPYTYKIFKWCSNKDEYMNDPMAQSLFPNFEEGKKIGANVSIPIIRNGYLSPELTGSDCSSGKGRVVIAQDTIEGGQVGIGAVADFKLPEPLGIRGAANGKPGFVLYEAVTGNVFYYDNDGVLLNYDDSTYQKTGTQTTLDIVIIPDRNDLTPSRGTRITINPVSGRVITEPLNESEIAASY